MKPFDIPNLPVDPNHTLPVDTSTPQDASSQPHRKEGTKTPMQPVLLPDCPDCGGEGWFVYVGGPGRFDSRFGNWLPSERAVPCERCGGTGELDPDEDPNPTQANDDDDEDDDALFDGIDLSELPF